MKKITVIHHSADFDGLFCREIARKFLGSVGIEYIGWDFSDKPLAIPSEGQIYILDLPIDRVFGFDFSNDGYKRFAERVIWIDHHKSSIESHPPTIPGYRIDGVAACRLAWQWFSQHEKLYHPTGGSFAVPLAAKQQFIDRLVEEPYAVQLAGEYDIWDKRNPDAEVFQFGLRSKELTDEDWKWLLTVRDNTKLGEYALAKVNITVTELIQNGRLLKRYQQQNDASVVKYRSFMVEFEGLKFLALNTARCNSLTFAAKDVPETGHDALLAFYWNGTAWNVSLYHALHRTDLDLSLIAAKHGGGGHRGACGFRSDSLPFTK